VPDAAIFEKWPTAVVEHLQMALDRPRELGIRVVDMDEGHALNKRYRNRDKATNVLSFSPNRVPELPGDEPLPLGDLVLGAPVVEREARQQGKDLAEHWAHLLVHGTLHLLGYDHATAAEAASMEALEVAILADGGIANPYTDRNPRDS